MAQSLKVSPFTKLGSKNNVLSVDYIHDTLETYNLKGSFANEAKFDYKVKITAANEYGKLVGKLSDDGKIQFPLLDIFTVQLCQRRNGDLKAHLDLGQLSVANKSLNLFTNVKTNTELSNWHFRFGTNYFGSLIESNTRLEVETDESPVVTHRNYFSQGARYFGFVTSLKINSFSLLRYDALLGYSNKNLEFNLKHESNSSKKLKVGNLTATGNYKVDDNTQVALEVQNKGLVIDPSITVGVQKTCPNGTVFKGKLNNQLQLSLASKYPLNNKITITAALQLAFKSEQIVDLASFPPIPFGVQFDLNL